MSEFKKNQNSSTEEIKADAIKHWQEIRKEAEQIYYEAAKENDAVNHPGHYQSYSPELQIECIDAMRAAFGDDGVALWCKLNAFKYIWRESSKGQSTDVKKAIWYLNKYLELDADNE